MVLKLIKEILLNKEGKLMKKCLHQVFRPTLKWQEYGVGDCTTCKADRNNKSCKWYYPISITIINVKKEAKK